MSLIKQLSLISSTAIALCLYTFAAKPSQAAVIDFNDPLVEKTGNFVVVGDGDINLSNTNATDADGTLQGFLNLNSLDLDFGGDQAQEGSAVKFNLAADAGDELSFTWEAVTNEAGNTAQNDFAFVSINGEVTVIGDVNSGGIDTTGINNINSFNETFDTAGNYEVAIGVVNVNDFTGTSILRVRDAQVVPEPLTILGSGVALAFGAILRRKYSQKQG